MVLAFLQGGVMCPQTEVLGTKLFGFWASLWSGPRALRMEVGKSTLCQHWESAEMLSLVQASHEWVPDLIQFNYQGVRGGLLGSHHGESRSDWKQPHLQHRPYCLEVSGGGRKGTRRQFSAETEDNRMYLP